MSAYNYVFDNWIKYRKLGYTWEEMKIIMFLARHIDAAKLQYKRITRIRTIMKKIIEDKNYQKRLTGLNSFFIDIEFLFSSFQKINYLLEALKKEKNNLLSRTYSKNKRILKHWKSARDWVEHPLRKIKQKRQRNSSDFGNMAGDYYSIAGEKYDVFDKSPTALRDIEKDLRGLF